MLHRSIAMMNSLQKLEFCVGGNYNDMDCHKGMYRLELRREFGGSYNLVHDGFYETFVDAINAYMEHSGGPY